MSSKSRDVQKAIRTLAPLLSEARKNKIATVVASRTNSIAVLLENLADEGNENAVLRSMDALGFQTLHRVRMSDPSYPKGRGGRVPMRTDSGARKWVTIRDWSDVTSCIRHLKHDLGYRIVSACPDAKLPISAVDFSERIVLAFGSESEGLSKKVLGASDVTFSLPMCGFIPSFNVSVSVAITLYHAYSQRVEKLVSSSCIASPLHY